MGHVINYLAVNSYWFKALVVKADEAAMADAAVVVAGDVYRDGACDALNAFYACAFSFFESFPLLQKDFLQRKKLHLKKLPIIKQLGSFSYLNFNDEASYNRQQ